MTGSGLFSGGRCAGPRSVQPVTSDFAIPQCCIRSKRMIGCRMRGNNSQDVVMIRASPGVSLRRVRPNECGRRNRLRAAADTSRQRELLRCEFASGFLTGASSARTCAALPRPSFPLRSWASKSRGSWRRRVDCYLEASSSRSSSSSPRLFCRPHSVGGFIISELRLNSSAFLALSCAKAPPAMTIRQVESTAILVLIICHLIVEALWERTAAAAA